MSSGNSRFSKKGRTKSLSEAAKEHQHLFDLILWNRSAEKFDSGLRSKKRYVPVETVWSWARTISGSDDFLMSSYHGGDYIVITTKKRQWGFLASETPCSATMEEHHKEISTPFVTVIPLGEV